MSKHVLIIGAGIIGLCIADELLRAGHRVTVVDRRGPEDRGCSFGNAGLIVPSHFIPLAAPGVMSVGLRMLLSRSSPFAIRPRPSLQLLEWLLKFRRSCTNEHVARSAPLLRDLHLASRAAYEELARQSNNAFGFSPTGLLMLCRSERKLEEESMIAHEAIQLGIPAETLGPAQTAALDPDVRMDICGSVFYPKDAYLSPAALMATLRQRVMAAGGAIHWQTEVMGWRTSVGKIECICTNSDEMTADEYVLCGGSWSASIARDLKLSILLQPGKGYSLTLPAPRRLPKIPAILTEARVAMTPIENNVRFGGTLEIGGLERGIASRRVRGIINSTTRYFPDFIPSDFDNIPVWSGLRPCSPDGLPYIGRTKRYENLCVATGHAMMGMSLGPVTGKLITQIISGEKALVDAAPLSPDRYDLTSSKRISHRT